MDLRNFIGKAFMFRSFGAGQRFLHERKFSLWMDSFNGKQSFLKESSFLVVPGLNGQGVSFKSALHPNRYIRHKNYKLYADVNDKSALFKKDATFNVRYGLAATNGHFGISFESVNYPGHFISLNGARGMVVKMSNSAAFKMSSTFVPVIAHIKIEHRTTSISCGFTCQGGRIQKGHDMAHSKEASRPHCAKKCCLTKGCIGFDYDNLLHDCWLSKTPWSKVPPTGGLLAVTKMSCQKNGVHDEPAIADITTDDTPIDEEYVYEEDSPQADVEQTEEIPQDSEDSEEDVVESEDIVA